MTLRDRAEQAARDIARRLDAPGPVAERLAASGRDWAPAGLAGGSPGIALLHATLGRADDGEAARQTAHRWLAAAVGRAGERRGHGLYQGVPALAFALDRAAAAPEDYRSAREQLNSRVEAVASGLAERERRRAEAAADCTTIESYDVVSGLTGLGAHLLAARAPDVRAPAARTPDARTPDARTPDAGPDRPAARGSGALAAVLAAVVALTRPLPCGPPPERRMPGWWVAQDLQTYAPAPRAAGHANVGLAHGIAGPLALLALAWRGGARVEGQREAVTRMVRWLLDHTRADAAGPWWPTCVQNPSAAGPGRDREERPGRPSWCYGTPGVARALQLAGLALDRSDWQATAVAAQRAALSRPDAREAVTDGGLCHGWAGLLQTTWWMARDSGDRELTDHLPQLAANLLALSDPAEPFGMTPPRPRNGWTDDPAGFLTGAAGAALALHTFATDTAPTTGWDRALLIA